MLTPRVPSGAALSRACAPAPSVCLHLPRPRPLPACLALPWVPSQSLPDEPAPLQSVFLVTHPDTQGSRRRVGLSCIHTGRRAEHTVPSTHGPLTSFVQKLMPVPRRRSRGRRLSRMDSRLEGWSPGSAASPSAQGDKARVLGARGTHTGGPALSEARPTVCVHVPRPGSACGGL